MATTKLGEVRDQAGHMFYGACLMAAFVWPIPVLVAPLLVMAVAVERELEQHNWDIAQVGKFDLLFWALACVAFVVVHHAIKA